MRIAILGAGFSGLATAWHLVDAMPKTSITVFDPQEIGNSTSGMAAGLIHPYAGAHAKLNWQGLEGLAATQQLIDVASAAVERPVAIPSGLLRLAITEEQKLDFSRCAEQHPDVTWHTAEECCKMAPGITPAPGIKIRSAQTVNSALYLQGLWKACATRGIHFEKKHITHLAELDTFDAIIVAMGIASKEFVNLPLTPVKGQILEVEWPRNTPPLPFPINSQAYIIMHPSNQSCFVGATFEKQFRSESSDLQTAKNDLIPKAVAILPFLENARILGGRAGIRASTPDHRPICKRINERCWVITGMGSKGLLYHALFAKLMCKMIGSISGNNN